MNKDKRNISTKNLYMAQLGVWGYTDIELGVTETTVKLINMIILVRRKKPLGNIYVDLFNKSTYKIRPQYGANRGDIVIAYLNPIVTNLSYISYNEATEILTERYSSFIETEDKGKSRTLNQKP